MIPFTSHSAGLAFLLVWATAAQSLGEVTTVELPANYIDFAMHPETGDIVAISRNPHEVVLLKAAEGYRQPGAKVALSTAPNSVCVKPFGSQQLFAVVGKEDSHLYVLQHDPFAVLHKIELSEQGVTSVSASRNPADPYVYATYGMESREAHTNVVNLRDQRDYGKVFDRSYECELSADGRYAYRREWDMTFKLESLIRVTSFTAPQPRFMQLYEGGPNALRYVPDPHGAYVASGLEVRTPAMYESLATLKFAPTCFFRKPPVMVGVEYAKGPSTNEPEELVFHAASYNTLETIGQPVDVQTGFRAPNKAARRDRWPSFGRQMMFGVRLVTHSETRERFFADERQGRLIYAFRNRLFLVPLTDFQFERQEPLLFAELQGPEELEVGQSYQLSLRPLDDGIQLQIQEPPAGLEVDGLQLTWQPGPDQIGPTEVAVKVSQGEMERIQKFPLHVYYPNTPLPFASEGIAILPDGKRAVVWEEVVEDPSGRTTRGEVPIRVAVLELATGKVLAARELANSIEVGIATDDHFIFKPYKVYDRLETMRISDLQPGEPLRPGDTIDAFHRFGKLVVLETRKSVEVFNTETLAPVKSFTPRGAAPFSSKVAKFVREEGLFIDGLLYDEEMNPCLVVNPGRTIPALPGADRRYLDASFLTRIPLPLLASQRDPGERDLPGTGIQVKTVRNMLTEEQFPRNWPDERILELRLIASGNQESQTVLARHRIDSRAQGGWIRHRPCLHLFGQDLLVAYKERIYRWPVGSAAENEPLRIVPRQSTLTLSGTGKTLLKHSAVGGQKPLEFTLLTPYEQCMRMDPETGTITIDESKLLPEATAALEMSLAQQAKDGSYLTALRAKTVPMLEAAQAILGRRPQGIPIAIPIRVDVTDASREIESLQYFVLAELPSAPVTAALRKRDAEALQAKAEPQPAPRHPPTPPAEEPPGQNEKHKPATPDEFRQRLDALEQRLDLISRQLETILQKLDE